MDKGPLSGILVLDFTRVVAGPFATAMLADQGAEVIKVEPPGGDDQRHMGAFRGGESLNFQLLNRNKRSLRLDLRNEAGRRIARALALKADVVIENFRPGVASRLGIGPELRAEHPRLIHCAISGFGQTGPMRDAPAYDVIVQALTGMMSVTGEAEGPPVLVGDSIGDTLAGIHAAQAIAAALFARERTGQGAALDVAMFDCLFSVLPTALAGWQATGARPGRHGADHPLSAPFGAYRARDGRVMIAVANSALFARLAETIGRPDLAADPCFASDAGRKQNAAVLRMEIEGWTGTRDVAEVVATLTDAGLPAAPIRSVDEAATSPQALARDLLPEVDHPKLGPLRLPRAPVRFDGTTPPLPRPAPDPGADGAEILSRHLGLSPAEIAAIL